MPCLSCQRHAFHQLHLFPFLLGVSSLWDSPSCLLFHIGSPKGAVLREAYFHPVPSGTECMSVILGSALRLRLTKATFSSLCYIDVEKMDSFVSINHFFLITLELRWGREMLLIGLLDPQRGAWFYDLSLESSSEYTRSRTTLRFLPTKQYRCLCIRPVLCERTGYLCVLFLIFQCLYDKRYPTKWPLMLVPGTKLSFMSHSECSFFFHVIWSTKPWPGCCVLCFHFAPFILHDSHLEDSLSLRIKSEWYQPLWVTQSIVYVSQNVGHLNRIWHSNCVYIEGRRPIAQDGNTISLIESAVIMNQLPISAALCCFGWSNFLELFKFRQVWVQIYQLVITLGYLLSG